MNETTEPDLSSPVLLSVLVCIVSIILNILLLIVIIAFKLSRDSNRFLFIAELSSATVVWTVAVLTREGLYLSGFDVYGSMNVCKTLLVIYVTGAHFDCMILFAIAADQYLHVAHPLRYGDWMPRRRAVQVACLLIIFTLIKMGITVGVWDDSIPCSYFYNIPKWHFVWSIFDLFVMMIGVSTFQLLTVRIARRQMRQLQKTGISQVSAETIRRHWRGVVTISLVCLLIFSSWSIGQSLIIWFITADINLTEPFFMKFTLVGTYLNYSRGIWTPIIYGIRSPEVRLVYAKIWNHFAKCKENRVTEISTCT